MTSTAQPTAAPLALVTGASSGIGAAFAQRLAADGYDLIVVGRRTGRLTALAESLTGVTTEVLVADLATDTGIDTVAEVCATRSLRMLVNNAGVAHYMPMADLPAAKARELLHVKVLAPAMLTRAALAGMLSRGRGAIINVAGMLAFAGPAPAAPPQGQRATYVGTLAATVAMTQTLHSELAGTGVSAHVVCPGIVATEFHEVQGMDLSAAPRMSAADVVTAALAGIDLGEVVTAPGLEDTTLLDAVFTADLAAFAGQSKTLASRYRTNNA
ncbi:short-subunit dehydrogenase [Nakamurella sp. UYEF19]|uniref:SDR family NAD(P)-dependent oxidoreductase n=1 Tax=Nakamurella sp. UYEF19 TaxID=1756392 RepID=UPI003393C21D